MIKRTCNARDWNRMRKLAKRGRSVRQIGVILNIALDTVRANMKGVRVAKDIEELDVDSEVIGAVVGSGGDAEEVFADVHPAAAGVPAVAKPFTAANPGTGHLAKKTPEEVAATAVAAGMAAGASQVPVQPVAAPAVAHTEPPELTPAQKGAQTKAANRQAAQAGDDAAGDPEFLE